nr:DUF4912 domain-containing protein [Brevibacillus sp. SYP-B805]
MSTAQIAKQLGLSVGQVKYQLQKARHASSQERAAAIGQEEPTRQEAPCMTQADAGQERRGREWQLPDFYGENVIRLMVQSPTVLYVYWEITWPRMRMVASYLQTDYREVQKGIRLYDVTDRYFDGGNAHGWRDFLVGEDAHSWYLPEVQPGRTYIADFGLFHQGRFCPILRSEPAATPRSWPAAWGEPLIEPVTDTGRPAWFEHFSYSFYTK